MVVWDEMFVCRITATACSSPRSDPEGRTCLAVEHDDAGRVARASADGRVHACACGPDATAVTEGTGERHTLLRGASGVTVGVSSTTGASWTATLDASNRVSTLALPGRAVACAYDGEGRVETVAETTPDGTTTTRSFEHDGRGRLVSATGGPDPVTVTYAGNGVHVLTGSDAFEYGVDDRGRVVSVRRGGEPEIRVGRDRAGDVVEISQGSRVARFGRDELGRIADAAFADGSSVRHSHDELGNLRLAERGDGSSVAYGHDRAGRTTGARETRRDGGVRLWTAPVDGIAEQASHDGPVELESASVAAPHLGGDPRGAIGEPAATAGTGGDGVVRVPADGVGVLMGDHRSGSQPVHGEAASAGSAPGAEWRHPAAAVPHLQRALALVNFAGRHLARDGSAGFGAPSDAVFHAAETRVAALPPETRPVELVLSARQLSEDAPCAPPAPQEVAPAPLERVRTIPSPAGTWATGTVESPGYNVDSLRCEEFGRGHYIVGDIEFSPATKGEVATVVSPPQGTSCKETDRFQRNIDLSIAHEQHHLDKYKEVLDKHQLMSRGPFASGECDANLRDLKSDLRDDFGDENTDQNCHRDSVYANERQRENYCDGANRARERAGARVYPNC